MLPKRKLTFVLPYLSKISLNLRIRLRQTIESILPYCKLKVIFRSNCRLNTLFWFKFNWEKNSLWENVSIYMCGNYKVTYYEKTFLHCNTRATEHMEIFNFTGKPLKNVKQSAISDYLPQCNKLWWFQDLAMDSNKFKLLQ